MLQSSDVANRGYNVVPKPNCGQCHGRGFFYKDNWAKTCYCKMGNNEKLTDILKRLKKNS